VTEPHLPAGSTEAGAVHWIGYGRSFGYYLQPRVTKSANV